MAFNISSFRSVVSRKGLLPTNKFFVRFVVPAGFNSQVSATSQGQRAEGDSASTATTELSFFCDSVFIPGITMLTSENRRYGYGPVEKRPIVGVSSDIPMTFLVDGNGDNVRFFQSWLKLVYNFDNRQSTRAATGIGISQYPYEVSYKDQYATDIEILVFNSDGGENRVTPDEALCYTLREAYPTSMVDIPLNWADNNNIMRLPVVFTCFDWYEKTLIYNGFNTYSNDASRAGAVIGNSRPRIARSKQQ
jgi:hypothetical protein